LFDCFCDVCAVLLVFASSVACAVAVGGVSCLLSLHIRHGRPAPLLNRMQGPLQTASSTLRAEPRDVPVAHCELNHGDSGNRGCCSFALLACLFVLLLTCWYTLSVIQQRKFIALVNKHLDKLHCLAVAIAFACYCYKLDSHW
jgi:hypothetical protein